MLVNGDKIRLIRPMGEFTNIGEVCDVTSVAEDGTISFRFGCCGIHLGCMSYNEFEKYFEKVDTTPTVTQKQIDELIDNSKIKVLTVFDKCTVVCVRLPNGFVLTHSSACASPENYDEALGVDICLAKIKEKLWELESFRLQSKTNK